MKRLSLLIVLSLIFLICSDSIADTFSAQALSTAETFAATIDSQDYQGAYLSGSALFRLTYPQSEWIDKSERTGKLLGKAQQRKLKAVRAVSTYPGLPDGDYLLVYFEVQTERKDKAAEVMLVGQVGSTWQVCSYSIR